MFRSYGECTVDYVQTRESYGNDDALDMMAAVKRCGNGTDWVAAASQQGALTENPKQ